MNKYSGGSFEDFLKEEGIFEEVVECTRKRLLVLQLGNILKVLIRRETAWGEKTIFELVKDI